MNNTDPFSIFDRHFQNIDEMLTEKTVLFVGAGSSKPYGLPLGTELQDAMLANFNDSVLLEAGFNEKQVEDFKSALRYNKYGTIDEFFENKFSFKEIGSYSVTTTILTRENEKDLFSNRGWYGGLIDSLDFEREIPNIKNLAIISLNYDRSFEHFLIKDNEHNFDGNTLQLAQVLSQMIKIYHPHGCIGNLSDIGYGINKVNPDILKKAAKNIKITSDDLSKSPDYKNSIIALSRAQNIIFLGFGYDKYVLKKYFNNTFVPDKKYFGTAINIQPKRADEIRSFFENAISFGDKNNTCDLYLKRIGVIN